MYTVLQCTEIFTNREDNKVTPNGICENARKTLITNSVNRFYLYVEVNCQ